MPVFSDGQKMTSTEWARLIQSVPASYVVWKDGTTYRAECLLKGGTDYSGTDATTVIQAAIDALTSGGKIFLRAGEYVLSSVRPVTGVTYKTALLIESDGISIVGEGKKTVLKLGNNMNANVIDIEKAATSVYDVLIADLAIDGNKANQTDTEIDGDLCGIRGHAFQRSSFQNLRIHDCKREGLYVTNCQLNYYGEIQCDHNDRAGFAWDSEAWSEGINIRGLTNGREGIHICGGATREIAWVTMLGGESVQNTMYGVYILNAIGVSIYGLKAYQNGNSTILDGFGIVNSESVYLTDCQAYHNYRAGVVVSGSERVSILGGTYYNNRENGASGNGFGVCLSNATYTRVIDIDAYDNQTPKKQLGGVQEVGTSDYNTVAFNDFRGNANDKPVTIIGSNTKCFRNRGFVTENSGSSTGTGAQQTIPHGLVSTPYDVSITPTASGTTVSGLYTDATNIYVTVTSGKTYNWSAEV